ncbi:MAG: hypothetical protein R3C15_12845 [Thermoleophilia bacterium]
MLNLGWRHRLSALASVALAVSILRRRPAAALAALVALAVLNRAFYGLLARRLGPTGAAGGVGLHALHHLSAVAAAAIGAAAGSRAARGPQRPRRARRSADPVEAARLGRRVGRRDRERARALVGGEPGSASAHEERRPHSSKASPGSDRR